MSLHIVSSDWRFKGRFRNYFSREYLHEYSMVEKLLAALAKQGHEDTLWVIADEKLGSSSQGKLLSELQELRLQGSVLLFLDRGHIPFKLPSLPFPVEFVHKESLDYQMLFSRLGATESVSEHASYCTESLIGESNCMQEVREALALYAKQECSIHLFGETGTGKEIAASIIHRIGNPSRKMVPVNCSLLQGQLGDSIFFGHVKGAFTDGKSDLPGLVHDANDSTLFLDEVENLSLESQANMLRLLENGNYRQIGDTQVKSSRFKLVSASNKNLKMLIKEHRMRKDFYYRISDTTIRLPPLREHAEDIPLLSRHFLKQHFPGKQISEQDMKLLQLYSWPGNVRQLFSTLKRSSIRNGRNPLLQIDSHDIA